MKTRMRSFIYMMPVLNGMKVTCLDVVSGTAKLRDDSKTLMTYFIVLMSLLCYSLTIVLHTLTVCPSTDIQYHLLVPSCFTCYV